jgi:hypothetical protein
MAARKVLSLRRHALSAVVGLCLAILGYGRAYAAAPIRIHSPAPNAIVSNLVTTTVRIKPTVARVAFMVDGNLEASSASTTYVWDSNLVPNGMHTISAMAYSASNQMLRLVSERVKVSNRKPTATPTRTSTPTATPTNTPTLTPTATSTPSACVSITAPAPNAAVSGTVAINTNDLCAGVWFESLYVDGAHVADFPAGQIMFTTTPYSSGNHTIQVTSQSTNPGSVVLGSASEALNVQPASTPTATLTATPSATPTSSSSVGATPTPTPTSTPSGATFFVSTSGSDSASGSSGSPWRTIQKAADTLLAGQTAIVSAGNYGKRVSISRSGTSSNPITLQVASGADAQLLGFDVTGSNWVLNGFDISTQTNGSEGYGIHVDGSASYDTIQNTYIHELCHEGIFMESGVSHVSVLNNKFWRCEMSGVQADGMYDLIEGNEVWDTQQYAMNAGGIYSVCTIADGADADAFRFFGQHNVFRSNYAHDIYHDMPGDPHPTNPNPHTDCFQTWGNSAMTVSDILFDRNLCRWPGTNQFQLANINSTTLANIGVNEGAVTNLTFQNNILSNSGQGIDIESGVGPVNAYNNTFVHIAQEGLVCNGARTSADQIMNNIFYDVGDGGDSYTSGCQNSTFDNNDFYMPGGASVGTYPSVEPYLSLAPMFVNYGDSTGGGGDFHLQSGSPLKGTGTTISTVTNDYYGTSRVGSAYSVGAAQ